METETVAVIGSGLAGLSVAHFLSKSPNYKVTLLESAVRVGMDVASVTIKDSLDREIRLDAPMRGISKSYYPTLYKMYDYLKVKTVKAHNELAWSNWAGNSHGQNPNSVFFSFFRLHFRGNRLNWVFMNILRYPIFELTVVFEFTRLKLASLYLVKSREIVNTTGTFGEYLTANRFSAEFVDKFLVPFLVAIGTCTHDDLLNYPASIMLHLIAISDYIFYQVKGGVQNVCTKLVEPVSEIVYDCSIVGAWRDKDENWIVLDQKGNLRTYDRLIFAIQAGIAIKILTANPPKDLVGKVVKADSSLLSTLAKFSCLPVKVVIHTDETLMPHDKSNWRGLNVSTDGKATMGTIWMNYTHQLPKGTPNYFESSNFLLDPCPVIAPGKTVSEYMFVRSPVSQQSCEGINELENHQGRNNLYFVGSWVWPGMPLLEGCVASAARVAERLNVSRPWDASGLEAKPWTFAENLESNLVDRFLVGDISTEKPKESIFLPLHLLIIRLIVLWLNTLVYLRAMVTNSSYTFKVKSE